MQEDLDDLAMAIGHLSLSYASLELMLVRIMADVTGDGDLSAADHALGRRGFGEKIGLIIASAVTEKRPTDSIDKLEALLLQANAIAHRRHLAVHHRRAINYQQTGLPEPTVGDEDGLDVQDIWGIVYTIDSLISDLDDWSNRVKIADPT